MKMNIIKYIVLLGVGSGILASCINKYEDEPLPDTPQVAFIESIYPSNMSKTTGEILTIEPVIISGSNLQFEWKLNEEVVSHEAALSYELKEAGELVFEFRVFNEFGEMTKTFTVDVVESIIPGIIFNTVEQEFTKSIGETVKLSAKPVGSVEILSQKWEMDGKNLSLTGDLEYTLIEKGTYTIKYTVEKEDGEASATFTVNAISSEYDDHWFVMQDGEEYVFALADSPNKVLSHTAGSNNYKVETYSGAQNQKFRKGAYFGYGDDNIRLEYYNFYNVATETVPANNGTIAQVTVNPDGTCPADGWTGWYFVVNEKGNIRIVNFLQTWDSADAHNPEYNFPGALIVLNEDRTLAEILHYSRFKDGVYDTSEYDSFGDKYYDFKIVNVKDMAL